MKKASQFEKVAARCWNLLNEGKPFTPIFTIGTMVIYLFLLSGNYQSLLLSLIPVLPLFFLFYVYDFPLFLRSYLWLPFIAYILIWNDVSLSLLALGIFLYFFFTVFFWGSLYYRLRIGTTLFNFTRFWKLVLKNSDSTSGNAQEQLPKTFLLLSLWNMFYEKMDAGLTFNQLQWESYVLYLGGIFVYTWILHRYLFDWKPKAYPTYTSNVFEEARTAINDKVIVIVIDGMRKERFNDANTPFLNKLKEEGTDFSYMETVYPARTVVCFSSMFTGTYPFEHGIKSNMVWKLGIKVESIFDSLRKVGKKGKLLGIAHLVDSMGSDVETVTAVMHKDKADPNIMQRAKNIMEEQDPDLFIVQLIGTDQIGHSRGVLYDEYIEKIEEADALISDFVRWLTEKGKMDNTTLFICADHGQADGIGGHGHLDEGERYVPFIMHGPTIKQGARVDEKHSLVSMAPTIAYLLGAPYPNKSRGLVLKDAFKEEGGQ